MEQHAHEVSHRLPRLPNELGRSQRKQDHEAAGADDHSRGAPSRAAVFGHPIHAMLVPFPIAFVTGALAADLAAIWTGDPFWVRAAFWLIGAGALTGAAAALFGLFDFVTIRRARSHAIRWVHAVGAGATVLLATANWALRLGNAQDVVSSGQLTLSALAAATLLVTGWAGGDLAYRHLVGVSGHGGHDHDRAGGS